MDATRFDTVTRTLTRAGSRRRALAAALAASLGLLSPVNLDEMAAAKSGNCKPKCGECARCKGGECEKKEGHTWREPQLSGGSGVLSSDPNLLSQRGGYLLQWGLPGGAGVMPALGALESRLGRDYNCPRVELPIPLLVEG